jgi:WD40 repeat protein
VVSNGWADEPITGAWQLAELPPAIYDRGCRPDGRTLASGGKTGATDSKDRTIRLWEVATGQEKAILKGHDEVVLSVAFSPDGRTLASGSGDKTIKLWDAASGRDRASAG